MHSSSLKVFRLFLFAALVLVIGSCKSIRELKSLSKCQFRIGTVKNIQLGGVNIQTIRKFSDVKLADAAKITAGLLSGKLPLSLTINLEAKNPNKTLAAMNRVDWIAMIDQTELLTGFVGNRIEIQPNGGVATIPLNVAVDLKHILKSFGKSELLDFATGLVDGTDRPTRVALKLKPTIMVGKKPIEYPGWFTVKRDFVSE
jgi:hypothetical protein